LELKFILNELRENIIEGLLSYKYFKNTSDIFLGVRNKDVRKLSQKYYLSISFDKIEVLLKSNIHEEKLLACFVLVEKYLQNINNNNNKNNNNLDQEKVVEFYLNKSNLFNNWDLVDLTAYKILGEYLFDIKDLEKNKDFEILDELINKNNIWSKRIAVVSIFTFIKNNEFKTAFYVINKLILKREDMIEKPIGWMLREIGKRDMKLLEDYLKTNIKKLPRISLRYAIEKFDENKRKYYLNL